MDLQLVDVTLDNLPEAPDEVLSAVYWELQVDEPQVDPRFEKEEWFSSTLLEWGSCGRLLQSPDTGVQSPDTGVQSPDTGVQGPNTGVGFAQYAPASLFPRLAEFRCGKVSRDAVYLSYCYLSRAHRRKGHGADLVRAVARDLVERGYRALEAIGDLEGEEGWVLPASFLEAAGFTRIRKDRRFPLMRLDLTTARAPVKQAAAVATA